MTRAIQEVRSMVMVKLDTAVQTRHDVTSELIHEWVEKLATILGVDGPEHTHDRTQLVRDLEADYNIHIGTWNSLADDGDHVKWLDERKKTIGWPFWERYERYLRDHQALPPAVIRSLGEITDDILGRLEAPDRPGPWDRRGLVAGQVQSGKTGNYTGLIAKAIDSGYKLVVVLAGVHNSLRSQTQARIDEGILGFDTRNHLRFDQTEESNLIGVGRLSGTFLHVSSFTSSKQNGDFSLSVAKNIGVVVGGADPIVLVVKKNKSILSNLYKWATALRKETDRETSKTIVRGVPVLVIDDEADHASVDTNGPKRGQDPEETDPTAINGLIRKFLDTFEQTAYVAYTATPFANIFISPDRHHREAGEDLFPRSFIVNLPAPSTYVGPARVFGLQGDSLNSIDPVDPLPIVRTVADYDSWLPDGHKSDFRLDRDLPSSLKSAILAFLIGGAIRSLRGQGQRHNSMLIHVTRFTRVQSQVAEQVEEELQDVCDRLEFGEGSNPILRRAAEKLYSEDHTLTTQALLDTVDLSSMAGDLPAFDDVWREMLAIAKGTVVHTVNGSSADALEYFDHPNGLSVIAIGGDKLSRGLTLEGLSVSYYLRASKMYDTLMQMGRWFGYRPGYLDVCRLYTTEHLVRWYSCITAAAEELQAEFDVMASLGRSPEDFGLRVRQHPDGLLVTSPAKLRHSTSVSISYSAAITETVTFAKRHATANWTLLESLLDTLSSLPSVHTPALRVWRDVDAGHVLKFIEAYQPDEAAIQAQPKVIADYITARLADSELTHWTVALADVRSSASRRRLASIGFGLTVRKPLESTPKRVAYRRIGSPRHEIVDLVRDSATWKDLLAQTRRAWDASARRNKSDTQPSVPSGLSERHARSPKHGLVLIYPIDPALAMVEGEDELDGSTPLVGFAISFPASDQAEPVSYQVNRVFWEQEYGAVADIDEGESE